MRKAVVLAACILFFKGISFANQDNWGSMRTPVWRSSRTNSADTFVLIATGPIHFHGIEVGSGTVGGGSGFVAVFNTTSAVTTVPTIFSTAAFCSTNSAPTFPSVTPCIYDMYLSSGLVYNKIGIADVNILWDYLTPIKSVNVIWTP